MVDLEKLKLGNMKKKITSVFGEDKVDSVEAVEADEQIPGFVDISVDANKKTVPIETPAIGEVIVLSKEATTPDGVILISKNEAKPEPPVEVIKAKPETTELPAVTPASVMGDESRSFSTPVIVRRHEEMPRKVQEEESYEAQQVVSTDSKTLFRQESISKAILGVTVTSVGLSILIAIYDLGIPIDVALVVVASIIQFLLVAEYRKPTTVN